MRSSRLLEIEQNDLYTKIDNLSVFTDRLLLIYQKQQLIAIFYCKFVSGYMLFHHSGCSFKYLSNQARIELVHLIFLLKSAIP